MHPAITASWFDLISIGIAGGAGATLACYNFKDRTSQETSDTKMKTIFKGISLAFMVAGVVLLLFTLAPSKSEDFKRYYSASKASETVADLLQRFGARDLATREDLTEQRTQAEQLSKLAFEKASAISRNYLADSNAGLPDAYFDHFVPAMDSLWRGFASRDPALVEQGVSHYNEFIVWTQAQDRSDFKAIR